MTAIETDYVVVGSGLAGLTFALHAAEFGNVCVVTKAEIYESNTSYAQGGIAAAVGEADSWELHERDTLIAGAGLCDPDAVRFLVQNAPDAIKWLIGLGARFDTDPMNAVLALGMEGGHSRSRIVHHADKTGWEVERAVSEAVRKNPRITVFENAFAYSLCMTESGECAGAAVRVSDLGVRQIRAKATMIATGGCGKVYQHTTNPRIATGDGIGLAHLAGAKIENMEFMQFHPTTLYHPQLRSFLITEAVRGEGGTLRNHHGTRFMYNYDDRLELAPRDIVARAIDAEMKRLDTWCVYLDTTHLDRKHQVEEFPTINERLESVGISMYKDWIPVVPAQHYSCGGIVTDLNALTNIPRLFAAGEVACTGVHGANRLASNSLLEAIVFAKAAAVSAQNCGDSHEELRAVPTPRCIAEGDAVRIRHSLQKLMTENAGIIRTDAGLAHAHNRILELKAEYESLPEAPFASYALETESLLTCAHYIVSGAMNRRENVGLHFNSDHGGG